MSEEDSLRFSIVGFAVAVVTVGAGTAAGLAFVPEIGTYVGMLLGGFVAGLVVEDRPLLESGVAAVLAGLGILLAGTLVGNGIVAAVIALASIDPTTLLVSVALSFAVGAFGANFGDDLRDGLTAPIEEGEPNPSVFESAASPLSDRESSDGERAADERGERRAGERSQQSEGPETNRRANDLEPSDVELEREK